MIPIFPLRGLKSTATFVASLREALPIGRWALRLPRFRALVVVLDAPQRVRIASLRAQSNLPLMHSLESVRIDKWLWAVRLFKSRSLATEACNAGHVKIGGNSVKPARPVRVGEEITMLDERVNRTVRVTALLERRVGAKLVGRFLEDRTPPEEYARAREAAMQTRVHFPNGFGRPTRKQRRQWEGLFR